MYGVQYSGVPPPWEKTNGSGTALVADDGTNGRRSAPCGSSAITSSTIPYRKVRPQPGLLGGGGLDVHCLATLFKSL
jgi:hypothetical protein